MFRSKISDASGCPRLTIVLSIVLSIILLMIALPASLEVARAQEKSAPKSKFVLSSPDAQLAVKVPEIYTANVFGCTGGNQSPPLQWVVYNLPATVDKLPKGAGSEHSSVLPPGTMQGRTDLGNDAYHGPCPDKGDRPHRYTFTVYALSVEKLDVPADSSGAMVVSTASDHLLGKAVFIAHYGR